MTHTTQQLELGRQKIVDDLRVLLTDWRNAAARRQRAG